MTHNTLFQSITLSLMLLLLVACVHKLDTPKGLPSDGVNRNPPGVVTR